MARGLLEVMGALSLGLWYHDCLPELLLRTWKTNTDCQSPQSLRWGIETFGGRKESSGEVEKNKRFKRLQPMKQDIIGSNNA